MLTLISAFQINRAFEANCGFHKLHFFLNFGLITACSIWTDESHQNLNGIMHPRIIAKIMQLLQYKSQWGLKSEKYCNKLCVYNVHTVQCILGCKVISKDKIKVFRKYFLHSLGLFGVAPYMNFFFKKRLFQSLRQTILPILEHFFRTIC